MTRPGRGAGGGLPLVALALVLAALALELAPQAAARLGWERAAIARGELWRLFTGHLVHGAPRLLLLDLGALALLGAWVERASRRLLLAALAASALASSLAVLACTGYGRYVGSSALASGLAAAAAVLLLRSPRRPARLVAWTLLALIAGKLALEGLELWPAALGGLPPGHEPVPAAHLAGALGGGAAALALRPAAGPRNPGAGQENRLSRPG